MKSCLGILLVFFAFAAVIGGGGLIWYLSETAEFSRKDAQKAAPNIPAFPKATVPIPPGVPKANVPIPPTAPKALPVR